MLPAFFNAPGTRVPTRPGPKVRRAERSVDGIVERLVGKSSGFWPATGWRNGCLGALGPAFRFFIHRAQIRSAQNLLSPLFFLHVFEEALRRGVLVGGFCRFARQSVGRAHQVMNFRCLGAQAQLLALAQSALQFLNSSRVILTAN